MNLKEYLAKRGAKPLDDDFMQSYLAGMEALIPEILRRIDEREERAAELRLRPWKQRLRTGINLQPL